MSNLLSDLFHFETVESTNETALELLKCSKAVLPFVVTADSQTKGVGTRGRPWLSPKGNLYMTCCFDAGESQNFSAFSLISGCAILKTFETLGYDFDLKLKWPNDIYCQEKKIGGILITKSSIDKREVLSIGIGLNFLSFPKVDNPTYQASALSEYYNDLPDLRKFTDILSDHLLNAYLDFQDNKFQPYLIYWNDKALWKDENVIFEQDNGNIINGIMNGASDDGSVIIISEGTEKNYYSGRLRRA